MAVTVSGDSLLQELHFTPEGERNPFPFYAALRELSPLYRWSRDGCWYATSYDVCRDLLLDPRLGHDEDKMFRRPGMTPEQVHHQLERMREDEREPGFSMISENPPSHTRLRRLVSRAFTTPRIERLRGRVEGLVSDRLDAMAAGGEVDLMETLAFPLPVTVISDLVGVPESEREIFRPFTEALAGVRASATEEELKETNRAFRDMEDFFRALILERRKRPEDDLLSALIAVQDEDHDRLTDQELRDTVILLYFAGFITTSSLIGNGMLALGNHPGEMRRLWADGSLVVSAVEEFLRYDAPVDNLVRDVLEPAVIADLPLDAGDHVILCIAAANRDPAHFADPDRLDITRQDNHPVTFGWGIHHCLGAPLARLEAQVTFTQMRERFSTVEVLDLDPDRTAGVVRRPKALAVRVQSR